MTTTFIVATGNQHKLKEINALDLSQVEFVSMADCGYNGDIEEYGTTLEQNAKIKADFIYERFGKSTIADDSGLEVRALNGAPGVYSARFAGPGCSFDDNVQKLLKELGDQSDRHATFRTVIHMIHRNVHHQFEGSIEGVITRMPSGNQGFGYDPVFIPIGAGRTFAEMSMSEKNQFSHRAKALKKLEAFLQSEIKP